MKRMARELDVFLSACSFDEKELVGKTAVVIDVMRASSTILTALHNGARNIVPVRGRLEAEKQYRNIQTNSVLLCGEENGIKIEGFDLGNSPFEYTRNVVSGKSIILTTTNGTKALKRSKMAKEVYIAGFLNFSSIVTLIERSENDVVLVCAGWRGKSALEDLLCAGHIIYEITEGKIPFESGDGSKIAFGLFEKFGNDIFQTVSNTDYSRRLEDIVDNDEIRYCCSKDTIELLPRFEDGIITVVHDK